MVRLDHQARPDRTGGLHTVQRFRAENRDTFPAYVLELTDEALARAIVARILDCGWTPPTLDQPSEEHDSA